MTYPMKIILEILSFIFINSNALNIKYALDMSGFGTAPEMLTSLMLHPASTNKIILKLFKNVMMRL